MLRLNGSIAAAMLPLIGLLFFAAGAQGYTFQPSPSSDLRPCNPTVARCDVELEIVNDRGIPQTAQALLAEDVADPGFHDGPSAPVDFYARRGVLAFNFNPGRFTVETMSTGGSFYTLGPYRFPLPPPGVWPPRVTTGGVVKVSNYPLTAGTTILITRNNHWDGRVSENSDYPEKTGIPVTIPAAGYLGQVVLPSFGTPRNPELSPRERGVLGALNDLRVANGAHRLTAQPDLNAAADNYACWLFEYGDTRYSHRAFGDPTKRAADAGWTTGEIAENIAWGGGGIVMKYQSLLDSPGHRANILDTESSYIGLSYNCGTLIMKFASVGSGASQPFGGWGDDVGDSSLLDWNDDPGPPTNGGSKRQFQPRVVIKGKKVKVIANRGARGKLIVRSGRYKRSKSGRVVRTRISRKAPLVIIFRARPDSPVASGRVKKCLKRQDGGKVRLVSCSA